MSRLLFTPSEVKNNPNFNYFGCHYRFWGLAPIYRSTSECRSGSKNIKPDQHRSTRIGCQCLNSCWFWRTHKSEKNSLINFISKVKFRIKFIFLFFDVIFCWIGPFGGPDVEPKVETSALFQCRSRYKFQIIFSFLCCENGFLIFGFIKSPARLLI